MKNSSQRRPLDEAPNRDFSVLSDRTDPTPNTDPAAPPEIKGRFKRGQSGNPKGRPKGSNNATLAARAILEENSARLMNKAVELAMAGSMGSLKLCLERLVPRDRPVQMPVAAPQNDKGQNDRVKSAPTGMNAPTEILAGHTSLLASVAAGEITPQEARLISTLLEARRRSWEVSDLSDQLDRIEDRHDRNKQTKGRPR